MCVINSWGYASYFMHFIRAYIASIIILASWCMHHLASIMVMHSGICTISIMHRILHPHVAPSLQTYISNSATRSWLEHFVIIPWLRWYINRHVLQSTSSKIIQVINSEQECLKHHLSISCAILIPIHKLCDECRRHLSSPCCDFSSMRIWSPFTLFSRQTHPCIIYPSFRYIHLAILQWLLPSTSSFSGVIAFCHFWWVICFSSLQSLSSESRDEILFRGGGCDSSCICDARQIFC
jgi:hypothetical protein